MKKILRWFIYVLSFITIMIISLYAICFFMEAPDIKQNNYIKIYDSSSQVFYQSQNQSYVSIDNISKDFKESLIAVEDHRFYLHKGFDPIGILRAIISNITNKTTQGASTITQQYARLLYLTNEKTYIRKISELFLALRLEMHYDKETILEGYMNNLYYGHGIYGIYNASLYYFNKEPQYLNLNEASMLAGVINGPEYYSPFKDMKRAKERQSKVLDALVNNGYISEERKNEVLNTKLVLNKDPKIPSLTHFPYYKDTVIKELQELGYYEESYIKKGLNIYTTLDSKIQSQLELTVNEALKDREELENASMIIDTKTSSIQALIGGRNYNLSQFNRTTQASRQVGSIIKPILYYIAIQQGFAPDTKLKSEPTNFVLTNGESYSPSNYNHKYAYKDITLAQALSVSDNIYAVKTHLFLGENSLVNLLKLFGYKHLSPHPSLALGTMNTNLYDLSHIYTCIANTGIYNDIHTIDKITDSDGNIIYEYSNINKQMLDQKSTLVLNQLMTSSFYDVYSTYLSASMASYKTKCTFAAKTGTTDYDALCVGYNPQYTILSWCGYDDNRDISIYYDTRVPKIVFRKMADYLVKEDIWYDPKGLSKIPIHPLTGEYDENGIIYWFK